MIRVQLPAPLRAIAKIAEDEVTFDLSGVVTPSMVVDAIEERYPMLRGTIRDAVTRQRRAFVRYYACEQDISHDSADASLPIEVISGEEPLLIIGAMSGG